MWINQQQFRGKHFWEQRVHSLEQFQWMTHLKLIWQIIWIFGYTQQAVCSFSLPISPWVFANLVTLTACAWEKCSYSWWHWQRWVTFSKACIIQVICRLYRGQYHDPQGEAPRVKAIQEQAFLTKLLRLLFIRKLGACSNTLLETI